MKYEFHRFIRFNQFNQFLVIEYLTSINQLPQRLSSRFTSIPSYELEILLHIIDEFDKFHFLSIRIIAQIQFEA